MPDERHLVISLPDDLKKILDVKTYPKNALAWGLMLMSLVVGTIFIYFPIQKKCNQVNQSLLARKQQIQQVKASGINLLSSAELARLQKESNDFKSGFVKISKVAGVLNSISEEAERNHLKVISIHSKDPEPFKPEATETTLNRLPIEMRLEANYQALASFLATLSEKSSKKFVVESFHLKRLSSTSTVLDCSMTLSFFAD